MLETLNKEPELESAIDYSIAQDVLWGLKEINGIRAANFNCQTGIIQNKLYDWQRTGENPPRLITSVGGSTETPSIVAPGNIITGLEALRVFEANQVPTSYTIRFASEYAIDANAFDETETRASMWQTAFMYDSFIKRFYPDAVDKVTIEVEPTKTVDDLPDTLLDLVGYSDGRFRGSDELKEKVERLTRYGKDRNPDITFQKGIRYLLSHTTIFEDVLYPNAESDFIIKIGAPSEMQFSEFQQEVMDEAIALGGIEARLANPNQYGPYRQISLFGSRLGSRPPYYKQAPEERDVLSDPISVEGVANTLPAVLSDEQRRNALLPKAYSLAAGDNPDLAQRYRGFFGLLNGVRIRASEYQDWLENVGMQIEKA
ncbi:MAG: hypothetical protein QG553_500 [Patescibacteria group bacterium]|nr:hypothetical protein [Patescibacteria group bacterium]